MAELRKPKQGERFKPSAKLIGATVDAIRYVEHLQRSGGAGSGYAMRSSGIVSVENTTESVVDRHGVLGISNVWPTPDVNLSAFESFPLFYGVAPVAGTHEGNFAILLEPLAAGKIGTAILAGVCVAKVDVRNDDHIHAEIKNAETGYLESNLIGSCRILWKESGTGVKWCIVRLADVEQTLRFEIKSGQTLTPGGSVLGHPLTWTGADYEADSSIDLTFYDPFTRFRQSSPPAERDGVRGYAKYGPDSGRLEIQELEHQARWIEFVMTDDAPALTVDGVTYHDGYEPTTPVSSVDNTSGIFAGWAENDVGIAHYDLDDDTYYIWQMECP